MANTDKRLELSDGRTLAYAEYGAPDGTPVFYFHGHPGSRLEWPTYDPGDAATALNARVIAIDRPGLGLSDPKPAATLLDGPDDVAELADALRLDRFAVLGASGGGPYAAACAFKIPHRLVATAILCGIGPADAPGPDDATPWQVALGRAALTRQVLLFFMALGLQDQPERFVDQVAATMTGPDKALLTAQPELAQQIIERCLAEALRQGPAALSHEAKLYAAPWGFRLEDITSPVHLWHGGQDDNVPISVGRYVADAIPACRAHFVPDEGHLSLVYRYAADALRVLVEAPSASARG